MKQDTAKRNQMKKEKRYELIHESSLSFDRQKADKKLHKTFI